MLWMIAVIALYTWIGVGMYVAPASVWLGGIVALWVLTSAAERCDKPWY